MYNIMKKNLFLVLFTIAAICVGQKAQAQVAPQTNTANLSINLDDALSFVLADQTVTFTYPDADAYATSQQVTKLGHLTIVSNRKYDINVKASALAPSTGTISSPTDGVAALASVKVSVLGTPNGTVAEVPLSVAGSNLVTNATATTTSAYDIKYEIASADALVKLPAETYSSVITYTVTQQ